MKVGGVLRVLVAAGVGTGLVYGAGHVDGTLRWDRPGDRITSVSQPSQALDRATWTCPGPELDGQRAGTLAVTPPAQVLAGITPPVVLPAAAGRLQATFLPDKGTSSTGTLAPTSGGLFQNLVQAGRAESIELTGRSAPGSSVAQYSALQTAQVRGASFVQCGAATRDGWLLSGGQQPGRATRLVLSNPGASAVTVTAEVVTSAGRDPGSVAGVVVAARTRVVLALPSARPGIDPAIHVTSAGGPIVAWASDVWRDGETPVGMAVSGMSAAPARTQVLPVVTASSVVPSVRVANPGGSSAVVRVRATGANGVIAMEKVISVPAASTAAAALTGLAPGTYSIQVLSDEPVVAAAFTRTAASGAADLSWATAAAPVTTLTGTGLPAGLAATLGVTAVGGSASVRVSTVDAGGALTATTRVITPGAPVMQALPGARSVWITVVSGSVRAAVTLQGTSAKGPLLATTALAPLPLRSQAIRLVPADHEAAD